LSGACSCRRTGTHFAGTCAGILAFAEDAAGFDRAEEGSCRGRMQRVDLLFEHDPFRKPVPTFRDHALLLVEDNGHCGGSMVTFTGLYRRGR